MRFFEIRHDQIYNHSRICQILSCLILSCGCVNEPTSQDADSPEPPKPSIRHLEFSSTFSLLGTSVNQYGRASLFHYDFQDENIEILASDLEGIPVLVPGSTPETAILNQVGNAESSVAQNYYLVNRAGEGPKLLENFGWMYENAPTIFGVIPEHGLFLVDRSSKEKTPYSVWSTKTIKELQVLSIKSRKRDSAMKISHTFGRQNEYVVIEERVFNKSRSLLRLCTIRPFRQIAVRECEGNVLHFEKTAVPNEVVVITANPSTVMKAVVIEESETQSLEFNLTNLLTGIEIINSRDLHWADDTAFYGIDKLPLISAIRVSEGNLGESIPIDVEKANYLWGFSLSPDGKQLVSWDGANGFSIWQIDFPKVIKSHTFNMDLDKLTIVREYEQ